MNTLIQTTSVAGMDALVMSIDFTNVKRKLMMAKSEDGDGWTLEQTEIAEKEYRRFLTLIKRNPNVELVPNKLMDEFWHQHILDTASYNKDCLATFGVFIDHFPYYGIDGPDDKANLDRDFEFTRQLYSVNFGEEMDRESIASRCSGHACHVGTRCACRVPGACNNQRT